ncbi:MAG: hypothetical protein ACTSSH_02505 [Candidatus Heimdallarchaeota archaeon]
MKADRLFTIASLVTFFALIPALIILEVKVLKLMPDIAYLFIIMDILLVSFIALEIVLVARKWKKEKEEPEEMEDQPKEIEIQKEWDEKSSSEDATTKSTNGS